MVQITKQSAPKTLIEYKNAGNKSYEDFAAKDELRKSLVLEQHELCAYCMGKIVADSTKMKIEHFKSQTSNPELQLEYSNMLGCCKGNEGQSKKNQTCDTHKGDMKLSFNPSVKNDFAKMQIVYSDDGTIKSLNIEFDREINEVLNLNTSFLKNSRKSMIDSARILISSKTGTRTKSEIQKLIKKFERLHEPYYGAAVYYLNKKLKSAK